jgi:ABC-type nitrate/sulfonate/bicarbonate transport system substrate-binding protein
MIGIVKKARMGMFALAASLGLSLMPAASHAADPKVVRVGVHPVLDYQVWAVAKELGLDKEQNVSLDMVGVASMASGIAALRQGSLDVVSASQVGAFSFYKAIPNMRSWIVLNRFKGFIVVGRKGQAEPYASLVTKMSPEKAKEQVLANMKGKTFSINPVSYTALVRAAVGQAGMTLNDVKLVEFPDDAKAALAFEKGIGDYYMGSLPQEMKLLSQPDLYVNVGGTEVLGPAGLWYSAMLSMEPWMSENKETLLKLHAIWYRTTRYINEQPERVVPIWASNINQRAAASFSTKDVNEMATFLQYPTIEQAKSSVFNDKSELSWRKAMAFYIPQNKEKLPEDFTSGKYQMEQAFFEEFQKRTDLINWVNAPLKK